MPRTRSRALFVLASAVLLVLGLGVAAFAVSSVVGADGVISACYSNRDGSVRVVRAGRACKTTETRLRWSQKGPSGTRGARGAQGPRGLAGARGVAGAQGVAGPQGEPGERGPQGVPGDISALPFTAHILLVAPGTTFDACDDGQWHVLQTVCGDVSSAGDMYSVPLDVAAIPEGSSVRVAWGMRVASADTLCVRLFDTSTQAPVAGSEICDSSAGSTPRAELRFTPELELAAGQHLYAVQQKSTYQYTSNSLQSARIIVTKAPVQ